MSSGEDLVAFGEPESPNIGLAGDPIPVLFIGSVPRSGSTIISDLMNENPHMINIGELVHMWERGVIADNLCGCGQRFSECEFWVQVGKSAFGGWDEVSGEEMRQLQLGADRTRHIPSLLVPRLSGAFKSSVPEYGEVLGRILQAVVEVSGTPVIIDTSKHVSTALLLRRVPNVDLRVLHVVRDPRGVAHSWSKIVHRPEVQDADSQMATLHPGRIGLRWLWFNWAFANMDRLGVSVTTIRYEDFVAQPSETLDQIFAFAGLEPFADAIFGQDEAPVLTPGHSVAGNPRRLNRRPVNIRADEEWRSALDPKMRSVVTNITRPMLRRYKYIDGEA